MRILVIGSWGQLGTDVVARASRDHEVLRPTHRELDVTQADAVTDAISSLRPDAVINTAAFHKVDLCEADPATSFTINAVGAANVATACHRVGVRSVFISTDYVFSGEPAVEAGFVEDDVVGPINVYGISKAAGEQMVRLSDPLSLVVRGSGMFGHAGSAGKGGNFVDNMINRARSGQALTVVDDQVFAPTATHDMADRIVALLEVGAPPGIYHAANAGACSWFELAVESCRIAGIPANIAPGKTEDTTPHRPKRSILVDTKSTALGLPASRSWKDALVWYIEEAARLKTPSA